MSQDIKVLNKSLMENKIALVVGTRPGIIMFAPIIKKMIEEELPHLLIHTGQHYSPNMDSCFFSDLNLPQPDYHLDEVCQYKSHGSQTAAMLTGIEGILIKEKPAMIIVGGDANTNLAGALAGRKLGLKVAHLEAGERSFDWRMPEEHNRRMIDHISDLLFITGNKARVHLENESVQGKVFLTGNPIVDASLQHIDLALEKSNILTANQISSSQYILFTSHREENVDNQQNLSSILQGVSMAASELQLPVIFPVHPRTQKRMQQFALQCPENITEIEAVGYLDFLVLIKHASLVITDSGGVQQEACILKTPAVTVRENTEWTETLKLGANFLAGTTPDKIVSCCKKAISQDKNWNNPFGDGNTASMITEIVKQELTLKNIACELS